MLYRFNILVVGFLYFLSCLTFSCSQSLQIAACPILLSAYLHVLLGVVLGVWPGGTLNVALGKGETNMGMQ